MNRLTYFIGSILIILVIASCHPLDKVNLAALTKPDVYTLPAVAEAYVNNLYADFLPGLNSDEGFNSDEAEAGWPNTTNISPYLRGIINSNTYDYMPYDGIRTINLFLDGIDGATFDAATKNRLKGESLFWRAWAYFGMVKAYGGVELVLKPAAVGDNAAIFTARATTSACYTQIIKDLDDAIGLLPDASGNARINKAVAMAFKGRVTLFEASPQFNRTNSAQLWQAAYDANKAAVTYLDGKGFGLVDDFKQIWVSEMSKEVIMVKRYSYPESPNGYFQVAIWPLKYSESGAANGNMPSLELASTFPMKDGSKWNPNTMNYADFHQNRDDRFYYSIAYNGYPPYLLPMVGKENLWTYWYDKDGDPSTGVNGKEMRADFINGYESRSSFYSPKMVDSSIGVTNKLAGQIDWVEIRYAEVIMNLAEAANEVGKPDEAVQILGTIRDRAKILPGSDNKYGVTATDKGGIRQAIMDERFVEFAFETKRFNDLRRWRTYKSTMEGLPGSTKHGLRIEWSGTTANRPIGLENIDQIWNQFNVTVIEDVGKITMMPEDKYSFFGIPATYLERNSKLEQNNTWGGTFDPLK